MQDPKLKIGAKKLPAADEAKQIPLEVRESKIELFTKQSDEIARQEADNRRERQRRKIEFIGGSSIVIEDYIAEVMAKHETKFVKPWFYRLADVYGVDRKIMDTYVKPEFVRLFIIQFVYGRFPYQLLRALRSRNRGLRGKGGKLFQHLRKDASAKLDAVIAEVYEEMDGCATPLEFKMKYSKKFKLHFQVELF